MGAMVRPADPARDAAGCAAVYAPAILDGYASFEEVPPTADEMEARMRASRSWFVAERDGAVAGYAYAGTFNERAGYRWTVSVAVYVDPRQQGRGVGRALYKTLFAALESLDLRWAMAGIALPNPASVALHESFGFRQVALYEQIGFKAGAWRDVAWYQRPLR
jgi:phosphinothricin acetyltransferase